MDYYFSDLALQKSTKAAGLVILSGYHHFIEMNVTRASGSIPADCIYQIWFSSLRKLDCNTTGGGESL